VTPEQAEEQAALVAVYFKKLLTEKVEREVALELSMRYASLLLWYANNPPDAKEPWELP